MSGEQDRQGCLSVILKLFGLELGGEETVADSSVVELPYRRNQYLFSKAERSFFGVLQTAVDGRYLVFAKVRLGDILYVPKGTEKWKSHFNRIQSKHVDFLLCDLELVRPLLAIELDDSSHNRPDREKRDAFVDAALAAAGLPILHVTARAAYNVQELTKAILEQITK